MFSSAASLGVRAVASGALRGSVRPLGAGVLQQARGLCGIPDRLTLTIACPHETVVNQELVKMVVVPGTEGEMGILAGHVPLIAQLKPGPVQIHYDDEQVHRYFVSGGFCIVKDSKAEITVVEAVKTEDLDSDEVNRNLTSAREKVSSAPDDFQRAIHETQVEVLEAMNNALQAESHR